MKRKMKKIFGAILYIFAASMVFALPDPEEIDWNLSIEPLFGAKIGELGEFVHLRDCVYSDNKLSELNWEYKPIFYLGAQVAGGWKGVGISTYITVGLPKQCGVTKDSDWQNILISNAAACQYKTNYSESDNYLDSSWSWGVKGGYTFKPWHFFEITPYAAFDIDYKGFTAKDGSYWYGKSITKDGVSVYAPYDDDSNNSTDTFSGAVIGYNRYTYLVWLGTQVQFNLPYNIGIQAGFQIAPYMYSDSRDSHLLTKRQYADIVSDSFTAYKATLAVSYAFTNHIVLSASGSFFYAKKLLGDNYSTQPNGSTFKKSSAVWGGASEYYFDVGFSLRYIFF